MELTDQWSGGTHMGHLGKGCGVGVGRSSIGVSRAPASSLQAEAHPMDTAGVDLEKDSGRTGGGERKQQAVLGFWDIGCHS